MMSGDDGRKFRGAALFTPLRHETVVDKTVDKLLTAIALGEFGEGDQLPTERELVEQLCVARATVREAISRLSRLGVVEVRRGRWGGTFVRGNFTQEVSAAAWRTLQADWPQLKLMLDLRSLVEGLVASTAAERVTATTGRRISDALAAHSEATTPRDVRTSDRDFHIAVAGAARNPYLVKLRDDLAAVVGVNFGLEPYVDDAAVTRRAVRQHCELAEAILSRDSQRASEVARRHFTISEKTVRAVRERARAE
jgi:GntR family transcriptional repressor for pyruvate dehydrogenase complex